MLSSNRAVAWQFIASFPALAHACRWKNVRIGNLGRKTSPVTVRWSWSSSISQKWAIWLPTSLSEIANLEPSAKHHPNWPNLIAAVAEPKSQWELQGLSDCHGPEQLNNALRQQRANSVRAAALPPAAAAHIVKSSGASLDDCITDNENPTARDWNRAVLISAVQRELDSRTRDDYRTPSGTETG